MLSRDVQGTPHRNADARAPSRYLILESEVLLIWLTILVIRTQRTERYIRRDCGNNEEDRSAHQMRRRLEVGGVGRPQFSSTFPRKDEILPPHRLFDEILQNKFD